MKTIKWEYSLKKYKIDDTVMIFDFNKLGQEGWEMCGVIRGTVGQVFFFKRLLNK